MEKGDGGVLWSTSGVISCEHEPRHVGGGVSHSGDGDRHV